MVVSKRKDQFLLLHLFTIILYTKLISADNPEIFLEAIEIEEKRWIKNEGLDPQKYLLGEISDGFSLKSTEEIHSVSIACKANYPVYWLMSDVQPTTLDGASVNFKVNFKDVENPDAIPQPEQFISYLNLRNIPSLTGLYICRSVKDENVSLSLYVYLAGKNNTTLVNSGEELEIGLNDQDSVLLACKVTRKDANVTLQKKGESGEWTDVPSQFDPNQGFTLKKNDSENLTGTYKCFVDGLRKEEVIIHVKEEFSEEKKEFPIKNATDGSASWGEQKNGFGIECCSNNDNSQRTQLYVVECVNHPDCEIKKHAFAQISSKITSVTKGVTPTIQRKGDSRCVYTTGMYALLRPFILQCKGEGVDVSGEIFVKSRSTNCNTAQASFIYESVTEIEKLPDSFSSAATLRTYLVTGEEMEDFHPICINRTLFEGQGIIFQCCGMHYHSAMGRVHRIGWSNGSVTILPNPAEDDSTPFAEDHCFENPIDGADAVELHPNMTFYECVIPLWKGVEPMVERIDLNVIELEDLVIAEQDTTVSITYNENQSGLLYLNCSILKFPQELPPPRIQWLKDDEIITPSDRHTSIVDEHNLKNPTSTLLFMRAFKEIAGEYQCMAASLGRFAGRTFVIKINPRGYADYWVALVVFGGFFCVMILIALKLSRLDSTPPPVPSMKVELLT